MGYEHNKTEYPSAIIEAPSTPFKMSELNYHNFYGNKRLTLHFGFPDLKYKTTRHIKMSEEEFKEAISGDVVKFEKEGDFVEGVLKSFEPSIMYPDSFAIKVEAIDGLKTVFVSKIVTDLIASNGINCGMAIKIVYQGKKKTQDGKRDYNDYKVFWK